jgi:hypothetical protein
MLSLAESSILLPNQCDQQQRDNYSTFAMMNFLDKSTKVLSLSQGECECFSQQNTKAKKNENSRLKHNGILILF